MLSIVLEPLDAIAGPVEKLSNQGEAGILGEPGAEHVDVVVVPRDCFVIEVEDRLVEPLKTSIGNPNHIWNSRRPCPRVSAPWDWGTSNENSL